MSTLKTVEQIKDSWANDERWKGIVRPYTAEEVVRLRGSIKIDYTLATLGSKRLWKLLKEEAPIGALGAMTGSQAVEEVSAGLKAIYLSGWQVAADANTASQTYPDQSLYPVDSVPNVIRRINNAFIRQDQIETAQGNPGKTYWFAPIVADAEAGFGGNLNAYELMKHMIEAGASGVHFEDQVASQKKCGHLGGKVLVPTQEFIDKLVAARLAADVLDVPTLVVARTDANAANLLTSDVDERDRKFMTGERTREGFYYVKPGIEQAIDRAISYAPYADLVWCETSTPDLAEAKLFADAVHAKYPGKMLAYNCSPSFNWSANLSKTDIATFREKLGEMGYAFQFITLAGFHALNYSMFELASDYAKDGMAGYVKLQDKEFASAKTSGYRAVKHQQFVGTGYFDQVNTVITGGTSSTLALKGSTEEEQFKH